MEAGAYCLPPDVRAGDWKGVTCGDQFTGRHREMLMELTAARLNTYRLLSSPTPVTVYRITGEQDVVPAAEVTVTYWLRVFARTDAPHPQARTVTRMASKEIARKLNEIVIRKRSF